VKTRLVVAATEDYSPYFIRGRGNEACCSRYRKLLSILYQRSSKVVTLLSYFSLIS